MSSHNIATKKQTTLCVDYRICKRKPYSNVADLAFSTNRVTSVQSTAKVEFPSLREISAWICLARAWVTDWVTKQDIDLNLVQKIMKRRNSACPSKNFMGRSHFLEVKNTCWMMDRKENSLWREKVSILLIVNKVF